jgi:hypothetical protein
LQEPNLGKTNHRVSLFICPRFVLRPLSDSFIFLTLIQFVVVVKFINFRFALFTPPLGDFQGAGKALLGRRPCLGVADGAVGGVLTARVRAAAREAARKVAGGVCGAAWSGPRRPLRGPRLGHEVARRPGGAAGQGRSWARPGRGDAVSAESGAGAAGGGSGTRG